jgi:predicted SAM-dependent methyltransferase
MPITFDTGNYPYCTIVKDAHGCLHIFEGQQTPNDHPTYPKVDGRECDLFIQNETDVKTTLGYLTEEERDFISKGYAIQVKTIPDELLLKDY